MIFVDGAIKISMLPTSYQVKPGFFSGIGSEPILKLIFGSKKLDYKP